jgi:hypothetical protein
VAHDRENQVTMRMKAVPNRARGIVVQFAWRKHARRMTVPLSDIRNDPAMTREDRIQNTLVELGVRFETTNRTLSAPTGPGDTRDNPAISRDRVAEN